MKAISTDELARLLTLHKSGKEVIDLSGCDLSGMDLSEAYLEQANLEHACLAMCNLEGADLRIARLRGADLRLANLSHANLQGADLTEVDLTEAFLTRAQLQETTLENACLIDADLKWADLREANLSGASIHGANFYLSAIDSWTVTGIQCDFVFFDQMREVRNPPTRDFLPGEFERLHRSLPTIEYYFEHGFTPIDALLIDKVVADIAKSNPEFELELESYFIKGAIPRMKLSIKSNQFKELAYAKLKGSYEQLALDFAQQRQQIMDITLALIAGNGGKKGDVYHIQGGFKGSIGDNAKINIAETGSLSAQFDVVNHAPAATQQIVQAVEAVAAKKNIGTELIANMRTEIAKLPQEGVKALSAPTLEWIKHNATDLLLHGGEHLRDLIKSLF